MRLFHIASSFLLLGFSFDAVAAWHQASSDHFVIYANQNESEIRRFADRLERYHSAMSNVFSIDAAKPSASNRVTIYVVKSSREVQKLYGNAADTKYINGFYVARAGGSVAIVPPVDTSGSGGTSESELTLMHEYAHHFIAENVPLLLPRWFNEGIAEYFSTARFHADGTVDIGTPANHRGQELFLARDVSMKELLDTKAYAARNFKSYNNFYGRSWLLLHYLYSTSEGRKKVADYLLRLNRGEGELQSAIAVFGDLELLDKEVDSYLNRRRMSYWKLQADSISTGQINVRKLNEAEAAIIPITIRSDRGVDEKEAIAVVTEARKIAAQFPNEPAVQAALAEAEFDSGHDDAAIIAADKAIAAEPTNINALIQKGYAFTRIAEKTKDPESWTRVRKHFIAVNRIEVDHPIPLAFFYMTFTHQGSEPTKTAVDGLEWALQLSPYDGGLRMLVAQQQMTDKRYAAAIRTISPLAYNPHLMDIKDNPATTLLEAARKELAVTPQTQPSR